MSDLWHTDHRVSLQNHPDDRLQPMMSAALALSAATLNGSADFLGGTATRRLRPAVAVAYSQLLGLVATLVLAMLWQRHPTAGDNMRGAFTGVALASALLVLYRGLARYSMSIVSPVAAVTSALVPVGWGLIRGDRPSTLVLAGVGVAVLAVLAISGAFELRGGAPQHAGAAVAHGAVAGGCLGIVLVLLSAVDADSGLWPIAFARASAVVVLALALVSMGQTQRLTAAELPVVGACGVLGVLGHAAVVAASVSGSVVVVGVLASLYPAATVTLARVVHKERMTSWQLVGLPVALAAVALLVIG